MLATCLPQSYQRKNILGAFTFACEKKTKMAKMTFVDHRTEKSNP